MKNVTSPSNMQWNPATESMEDENTILINFKGCDFRSSLLIICTPNSILQFFHRALSTFYAQVLQIFPTDT